MQRGVLEGMAGVRLSRSLLSAAATGEGVGSPVRGNQTDSCVVL